MNITRYKVITSFESSLNIMRNYINLFHKSKLTITEEDKITFLRDFDNLRHLILLYILIIKHNISGNDVVQLFKRDVFRFEKIIKNGHKNEYLSEPEKQRIVEKAALFNEYIQYDNILCYKQARNILSNIIGGGYEKTMPIYDEQELKLIESD